MKKNQFFWIIIVNLVTFSRVVGSILLFPLYFSYGSYFVGYVLSFLFLTDWVDGFLARKHHVSTFFGSILDSISDKLMAIVACIILCFMNKYMIYSIIIEILIVIVNTLVFTQKGNLKSSYIGKVKTWVLSVCIIVGFFICDDKKQLTNLCIALPVIMFELVTLVDYIKKLLKLKIKFTTESPKYKKLSEINEILFSPEFYEKNKDKPGLINNIYENGK